MGGRLEASPRASGRPTRSPQRAPRGCQLTPHRRAGESPAGILNDAYADFFALFDASKTSWTSNTLQDLVMPYYKEARFYLPLDEKAAAAIVEFATGPLADNPVD